MNPHQTVHCRIQTAEVSDYTKAVHMEGQKSRPMRVLPHKVWPITNRQLATCSPCYDSRSAAGWQRVLSSHAGRMRATHPPELF